MIALLIALLTLNIRMTMIVNQRIAPLATIAITTMIIALVTARDGP